VCLCVRVWSKLLSRMAPSLSLLYPSLTGHTKWVRAVALHGPKGILVSSGADMSVRLWDLNHEGLAMGRVDGAQDVKDWVVCMAVGVTKRRTRIATGGCDKNVRIFDLDKQRLLATMEGHTSTVSGMCFVNENTLASSSYDASLALWDVGASKRTSSISLDSPVTDVAVMGSAEAVLAVGLLNGWVGLADTRQGKLVKHWEGQAGCRVPVAVLGETRIAAGGRCVCVCMCVRLSAA